jgi:hypothetical protein
MEEKDVRLRLELSMSQFSLATSALTVHAVRWNERHTMSDFPLCQGVSWPASIGMSLLTDARSPQPSHVAG